MEMIKGTLPMEFKAGGGGGERGGGK